LSTAEITKLQPIEGGLVLLGNPKQMLRQAQEVAEVLMDVVLKQKLYQDIGKSRHIEVPAWQFAAHFYGISAKIVEGGTVPYIDELTGAAGFKARAEALLINTGQVISAGEALCLNNEDNWSMRPKYEYQNGSRVQIGQVHVPSFQLMSMAQTRAIGKALSNVLRFVVVLAGFADTPAEEMTGDETGQPREERKPGKDPERKSEQAANGNTQRISEAQRKRLFAIAHEVNCPMNTVGQIIQSFGFDIAANITREKYDALVKAVQEWQAAPANK
jgi:hypothetical protein